MTAPRPDHEEERLAALARYAILDTPEEQAFDDIVRLVAEICEAPIAVINLIDRDRQFFKAEIGLGVRETPVDVSLCAHALLQSDLFIVPDTLQDTRFVQNPLVTGEPYLRFYAGALLETHDGHALGTLCVLDYRPRDLTEPQKSALRVLARQVMAQLELRRVVREQSETIEQHARVETALRSSEKRFRQSEEQLREARLRLEAAMAAGEIATWTFDLVNDRVVADDNLARLFSVSAEDAAGGRLGAYLQAIHPEDRERVIAAIAEALEGSDHYETEYRVVQPDGSIRWLAARGRVERDALGRAATLPGVNVDITARKQAEDLLRRSEERFRALFTSMGQGVLFHDAATRRLTDANPAAERILGATLEELQGRQPTDSQWQFVRADGSPLPGSESPSALALASGQASYGRIMGVWNPRSNEIRWLQVDAVPQFRPGEDRPFRVFSLFEDITEQRALHEERERLLEEQRRLYAEAYARAERAALVNEIGEAVRSAVGPAAMQTTLVERLGKALHADRCYLAAIDIERDSLAILRDYRNDLSLHPLRGQYRWSQTAVNVDELFPRRSDGSAANPLVLPDARSLADHIPQGEMLVKALVGIGLLSLINVPFYAGGRIVGVLGIGMANGPRVWTPDEIAILEVVAAQAHAALDAARIYERERNIAAQLQQALIPPPPPSPPGLLLAGHYRPALEEAGVGGDFWDVFPLGKGCTALVVADLSGKGLAAASQVATVRNMLRYALYTTPTTLSAAITTLNQVLAEQDLLTGFATLFAGVYDHAQQTLTYVNCGQEPGLVWRQATGTVEPLPPTGPVLGGFEIVSSYEEKIVALTRGDTLAVFTDGLTEVGPNRMDLLELPGISRLLQACCMRRATTNPSIKEEQNAAEAVVASLIHGVNTYAQGGARDDVALLVGVIQGEEN